LEIVSASGRAQGGGFTLEMQVGHSLSQQPMTSGSTKLEGGAAVKP
ncbi:MAG: hypothetical protein H6Q89_3651, partial [Myxococcaceae bacterium]|nr:hypothetical protein [Myxococcaceae bacterium]